MGSYGDIMGSYAEWVSKKDEVAMPGVQPVQQNLTFSNELNVIAEKIDDKAESWPEDGIDDTQAWHQRKQLNELAKRIRFIAQELSRG